MSSTRQSSDKIFTEHADGSVTVRGHDFTEVLRPWGHPQGFGCSGCHRESYNGEQRPVFLTHALRSYGAPTGMKMKATAEPVDRIARSVPREILEAIYHLPHWPVELIQIAECNPKAFVRLARSNPALLALLARESATHTLWGPKHFGRLLGRRENDICRQLSYPPDTAWLLRKIPDHGLLAHGYLDMTLTGWRRPGMRRLLRHVRRVTLDVSLTAMNCWQLVQGCPSLLHVASDTDQSYSTEVYQTVEEVTQMRGAMRRPRWPWRKINDLEHLRRIRKQTQEAAIAAGKLGEVVYPPPPVSPCSDWMWISNSVELEGVGQQMRNCASSYHWRCLMGDAALYISRRCAVEDTTIVVLSRTHSGCRWQVTDILGPQNALVDEEEEASVRRHFEEALEGGAE